MKKLIVVIFIFLSLTVFYLASKVEAANPNKNCQTEFTQEECEVKPRTESNDWDQPKGLCAEIQYQYCNENYGCDYMCHGAGCGWKCPSYSICDNNMCTWIKGIGENQCYVDDDCYHNVCDGHTCISVEGHGEDECSHDCECADCSLLEYNCDLCDDMEWFFNTYPCCYGWLWDYCFDNNCWL